MASLDEIKEALKNLDVTNDEHWTKDGAPLIAALGLADVSRKDVTEAAPHFTRENPSLELPESIEDESNDDELEIEDEIEDVQEETTEEVKEQNPLKAERSKVAKQLEQAQEVFHTAKKEMDLLQEKLDNIDTELAKGDRGKTTQADIMYFIKSQHAQRLKRATGLNTLVSAGLDISALQKAPIDQAMSRKNSRGSKRPVRTVQDGDKT